MKYFAGGLDFSADYIVMGLSRFDPLPTQNSCISFFSQGHRPEANMIAHEQTMVDEGRTRE
jgi:hypothetical protein